MVSLNIWANFLSVTLTTSALAPSLCGPCSATWPSMKRKNVGDVDLVDLDTTNRGGREPHAPAVAPADAKRPRRGQDPSKSRSHLVEELKPVVVEAPQEHRDSLRAGAALGKVRKASSADAMGPIPPMLAFADEMVVVAVTSTLGSFMVLPTEIIIHIMSFLSGSDVCQMRRTSSDFNRLGKDQSLWKAVCMREFGSIPNRLFQQPFNKDWEWLYRSKAVVRHSKDCIVNGSVCCYQTKECRYEGEWKDKELDGYGIELWSDGEVYEGWSTQGRLNGYGRASYTSGDTYIGMWKNGLRDGGTYAWSDGWKYEGEYQDGKLTGRGQLIFKNGSKYMGQWLDGERHGQGTMMYFDGSRFEGEWKNDKREGRGILSWPTSGPSLNSPQESTEHQRRQLRYEGFWKDDQILEGGKVIWEDGAELSLEESLKRLK